MKSASDDFKHWWLLAYDFINMQTKIRIAQAVTATNKLLSNLEIH